MDKVANVVSVWNNGEAWPLGHAVALEPSLESAQAIAYEWIYQNQTHRLEIFASKLSIIKILPDETGFIALERYDVPKAYILNGDASVRFVLTPAFNMRGFDAQRLALIEKIEKEQQQKYGTSLPDHSTCFHYVSNCKDKLEIFGDDGFGDCYYEYDWNDGQLISARTVPYRS